MLVFICPHMLKSLLSSNIFFSSISQKWNFVCGNHLSVVRPRPHPVLRPPLSELSQKFPSASNISILSLQTFSGSLLNHSHIISSWALIRERKCFLGFSHFSNAVTMASLGAHRQKNFLTSLAAFLVWGNRKRCMGNLLLAISCFFLFLLLLLLLFFLSCWWPLGLSQTSEMAKQREMKENKQRLTSPSILSIGKGVECSISLFK